MAGVGDVLSSRHARDDMNFFGGDLGGGFEVLFSGFAALHPLFGGGLSGGLTVVFGGFAGLHPRTSGW